MSGKGAVSACDRSVERLILAKRLAYWPKMRKLLSAPSRDISFKMLQAVVEEKGFLTQREKSYVKRYDELSVQIEPEFERLNGRFDGRLIVFVGEGRIEKRY
jgi:hypothetical protein